MAVISSVFRGAVNAHPAIDDNEAQPTIRAGAAIGLGFGGGPTS